MENVKSNKAIPLRRYRFLKLQEELCMTREEIFKYIKDSFYNGQKQQGLGLFLQLDNDGVIDFLESGHATEELRHYLLLHMALGDEKENNIIYRKLKR